MDTPTESINPIETLCSTAENVSDNHNHTFNIIYSKHVIKLPTPAIQIPLIDNISVVHSRLPNPPMSSSNIEAWFTTMDFRFIASGIMSDEQKATTVLSALQPNVITQLIVAISECYPVTGTRSSKPKFQNILHRANVGDSILYSEKCYQKINVHPNYIAK